MTVSSQSWGSKNGGGPIVERRVGRMLAAERTVPEKVRDFLEVRSGRMYCDDCIQQRLGLKWRQQVQLVTATLGVTAAFPRQSEVCSGCGERKQVIRAARVLTPATYR